MSHPLEAHEEISGTSRPSDVHDAQSSFRSAENATIDIVRCILILYSRPMDTQVVDLRVVGADDG